MTAPTATIAVPGAFSTWFDGTGLVQKQDDHDPECKSLRLAYQAAPVTQTKFGQYKTVTATEANLRLLQEYAVYCLEANRDYPDHSEVAAARKVLKRVEAALADLGARGDKTT